MPSSTSRNTSTDPNQGQPYDDVDTELTYRYGYRDFLVNIWCEEQCYRIESLQWHIIKMLPELN